MTYHPYMKWRKTRPELEDDFLCFDLTGYSVGHIHKHHLGNWLWSMNAEDLDPVNGMADDAREAARLVELAFYRATKSRAARPPS